ncbi:hypothetical protein [Acidiphilium sp. MT5]
MATVCEAMINRHHGRIMLLAPRPQAPQVIQPQTLRHQAISLGREIY